MTDRPRGGRPGPESGGPGSPDYDWLYGKGRGRGSAGGPGGAGQGGAGGPGDPEPTRMLPTLNRPGGSRGGSTGRAPSAGGSAAPPPRPPAPPTRPSGPPPGRPTRAPRRPGSAFRWVRVVLLLWLVFLVAVPLWAWTKVDKVNAEPRGDRPPEQPGHTYLLVGSDSREGLSRAERRRLGTGQAEGRRTDTIMLLHTGSGPNLLLSIPRDSIVEVPGYGTTKINAAYAYGGPRLLVETVENETGIRVDSYVEIGFGGFVDVVDAVGGIEICPKQAMDDPLANLDIKKGCQEADGPTALGYARSRKLASLGDIDRAQRQREVVSAVGSKAASPWSVVNPVRYARLAGSGADALTVGRDTGIFDTARFAWAMTRVSGKTGLTCGVPIADLAVNWDAERAPKLFALVREDRTADIPKDLCRPTGLNQ